MLGSKRFLHEVQSNRILHGGFLLSAQIFTGVWVLADDEEALWMERPKFAAVEVRSC